MLSVEPAFFYQSSNLSGFVPLNDCIPLNALKRLPFAFKVPILQQSCSFSRTSSSSELSTLDQKDARGFDFAYSVLPYQQQQQQQQCSSSDSSLKPVRHVHTKVIDYLV